MDHYQKIKDGFMAARDEESKLSQVEHFILILEDESIELLLTKDQIFDLFNYMVKRTLDYIEKENLKEKAQFILNHGFTFLKPEYIKRLEKIIKPKKTFFKKLINLFKLPSV